MSGAVVAIDFTLPPTGVPGCGSQVSSWLIPPLIQSVISELGRSAPRRSASAGCIEDIPGKTLQVLSQRIRDRRDMSKEDPVTGICAIDKGSLLVIPGEFRTVEQRPVKILNKNAAIFESVGLSAAISMFVAD